MFSKTFSFSRIEKTVDKIETTLNAYLEEHDFKFATQNESAIKGKFIVTIFGVKKKTTTIRAKAFKDQNVKSIDENVNAFIKDNGMKFVTQTFVGTNVYTIIFYDSSKEPATPPKDKTPDTTITAPATTNAPSTGTENNGTNQN